MRFHGSKTCISASNSMLYPFLSLKSYFHAFPSWDLLGPPFERQFPMDLTFLCDVFDSNHTLDATSIVFEQFLPPGLRLCVVIQLSIALCENFAGSTRGLLEFTSFFYSRALWTFFPFLINALFCTCGTLSAVILIFVFVVLLPAAIILFSCILFEFSFEYQSEMQWTECMKGR